MELAAFEIEKSHRFKTKFFAAIFDLDFFKRVNDTYGHLAGDEILRLVARAVKNTVRSYDILGRYGGEEFVVLMADSDETIAVMMANRIRENVSSIVCEYGENIITITCSIGIAEGSAELSLDEILNNADTALYQAKENGRNRTEIYRKPL
jgi:diguanylate cyclase (GGDEF)-like protein